MPTSTLNVIEFIATFKLIYLETFIMTEILNEETKIRRRKEWLANNKDKLAMYARKHYHQKVQEDPEYLSILRERVARNRKIREDRDNVIAEVLKWQSS